MRSSVPVVALVLSIATGCRGPVDVDSIRDRASPIRTDEPGGSLSDLAWLDDVVGDARIVALGEPTHGTRECFRMKHRIVEYLAREKGFSLVAFEGSMPDAMAVDRHVHLGESEPIRALGSMRFWPWTTGEVVDLVRWMRESNVSGQTRLRFAGFDMQQPRTSIVVVRDFFARVEPSGVEAVETAYNAAFAAYSLATRGSIARAEAAVPVEAVAGRFITFSAAIRTELELGGTASHWCRVTAPTGQVLVFDLRGDSRTGAGDWQRHEIALVVPRDATEVVLGGRVTGSGRAWFDDFELKVGEEVIPLEGIDGGFEDGGLGGFVLREVDARSGISDDTAAGGARSLVLVEDQGAKRERAEEVLGASIVAAREIEETVRGWGARLPVELPAGQWEWALQNARLVVQALEMAAEGGVSELQVLPVTVLHPVLAARDRFMADNVDWLLSSAGPDARIILWAHDLHVSRREGWMGSHLARRHGDDYVAIGFAFGEGSYRASSGRGPPVEHAALPPPEGSVESVLARVGWERFALDLRTLEGRAGAWAHEARPFRLIGPLATRGQFSPSVVAEEYDALVWWSRTTATVVPEG